MDDKKGKLNERQQDPAPFLPCAIVVLFFAASGLYSGDSGVLEGLRILPENATVSFPVVHRRREWKARLSPIQFSVLREEKTENPFTGDLYAVTDEGVYYSAATGQPLFGFAAKFDSGTGWPSFCEPISPDAVLLKWDTRENMKRVEILDSSSGSHLGHLFSNGPEPTGLRYCVNASALIFVPKGGGRPPLVKEYSAKYGSVRAGE